jgi:uroporphyrinogen decarboxylase
MVTDIGYWAGVSPADPYKDGFMPLVLRRYEHAEARLQAVGRGIKLVAARGPLVTAGWLMGIESLMTALVTHPEQISRFLDTLTTTIIRWLRAQLEILRVPEGILLLDDIMGMISLRHYEQFGAPYLRRIFDEFEGLIRVYHNDTPCRHLYQALAEANFDVFNFSHMVDIAKVKADMGHRVALMGNVPPRDVAVRQPADVVAQWAVDCLSRAAPGGGMILSVGGGVSPDTPAANLDAIIAAARAWSKL